MKPTLSNRLHFVVFALELVFLVLNEIFYFGGHELSLAIFEPGCLILFELFLFFATKVRSFLRGSRCHFRGY